MDAWYCRSSPANQILFYSFPPWDAIGLLHFQKKRKENPSILRLTGSVLEK